MYDWATGLSGLFGAIVGGAVAVFTSWKTQKSLTSNALADRQDSREQAQEERRTALESVAIDGLAQAMWVVKQHARQLPNTPMEVVAWSKPHYEPREAWATELEDILGPVFIYAEALHDDETRSTVTELLQLLADWDFGWLERGRWPYDYVPSIASDVIKTVGAYRRGSPMPVLSPKSLLVQVAWQSQREQRESAEKDRVSSSEQGHFTEGAAVDRHVDAPETPEV
ncbi:hypothetical protein [Streptacidiphilus sp. P02-A3a]|uniref:hypothetical protein n=1 Tax=Streptacidiphilus sp. P02-A3a TaxID=2704468 RepID=UPI0015F996DC|nr:hypothetical protein [Streptacidiphilus sp. P02-A3a]QMU67242.1 hypothetical protein GXP74_02485 [Streptacidiphilus sp. P02-A3a]